MPQARHPSPLSNTSLAAAVLSVSGAQVRTWPHRHPALREAIARVDAAIPPPRRTLWRPQTAWLLPPGDRALYYIGAGGPPAFAAANTPRSRPPILVIGDTLSLVVQVVSETVCTVEPPVYIPPADLAAVSYLEQRQRVLLDHARARLSTPIPLKFLGAFISASHPLPADPIVAAFAAPRTNTPVGWLLDTRKALLNRQVTIDHTAKPMSAGNLPIVGGWVTESILLASSLNAMRSSAFSVEALAL